MFHRHKWNRVREVYTPPASGWSAERLTEEFAERMMFGFTTIKLVCAVCGKHHFEVTNGDVRS